MDRRLLDYEPMLEALGSSEFEREAGRDALEEGPPFDDGIELGLAAELLSVTSDAGLDAFLAELLRRAGINGHTNGARRPGSPLAQALVARIREVGQPVLQPLRCIALGSASRRIVMRAARLLGLELEGLSPEDQEFALARQFVRFAGAAARAAARSQGATPAVAEKALRRAAREYAPGLIAATQPPALHGRWIGVGKHIALLGL
jgi:hypothetical protein